MRILLKLLIAFVLPLLGLLTYAVKNGVDGYCCGWAAGCGQNTPCTNKTDANGNFTVSQKEFSYSHFECIPSANPNLACVSAGQALCYQAHIYAGPNCQDYLLTNNSYRPGCSQTSIMCNSFGEGVPD